MMLGKNTTEIDFLKTFSVHGPLGSEMHRFSAQRSGIDGFCD